MRVTTKVLPFLLAGALLAAVFAPFLAPGLGLSGSVAAEEGVVALLAAPGLLAPADGAHTTGNPNDPTPGRLLLEPLGIPTFSWNAANTTKYELEIANTPAFGASVVLRRSNLQYTSYTPTGFDETGSGLGLSEDAQNNFIDDATFYWHVRAWDDGQKQWGEFSPTSSFTRHWGYVPQLTLPLAGSTESLTPYFSWEAVPGASFYQIQVDTSSSFGSPYLAVTTEVPFYTPVNSIPNDDDIFWRVRAFHRPNSGSPTGGRGGPWSEVRQFKLAWSAKSSLGDTRPLLLTPPNNANHTNRPLFCWQPVAGAKSYVIDVATNSGFVADSFVVDGAKTENTCFSFNRSGSYQLLTDTTYYWRVAAVDAQGWSGQRTDDGTASAPFQFRTSAVEPPLVPTMLYPPYYYPPVAAEGFEDRTVTMPTFVWDHVDGATTYQLLLDDDPAMNSPYLAEVTTENASYTFTDFASFPVTPDRIYYWKVRSNLSPGWSEVNTTWMARIDPTQAAVFDAVKLIQPTYQPEPWTGGKLYGQESLTYYPSFSWTAVAAVGSARYQVQIAYDEAFTYLVHQGETDFPEYTPIDRPEPGTYFWRVRPIAPVAGSWSNVGRFIVSRNFSVSLRPEAVFAPAGEAGDAAAQDLTVFSLVNDSDKWSLVIPIAKAGTRLGVFIDTDHFDGSGAPSAPAGKDGPQVPNAHLPEYAIYWDGDTDINQFWRWTGTAWEGGGSLTGILGSATHNGTALELQIPVTGINRPSSPSLLVFTFGSDHAILDRLPNLPGQMGIATFLTEGTSPTPLYPVNEPTDPALAEVLRDTPVLLWRHHDALYPTFIATYFFETFQDDTFSNLYESENGRAPNYTYAAQWFWDAATHWAPQVHYSDNDSYNWRVERSGWGPSAPHSFAKAGYVPNGLGIAPVVPDPAGLAVFTDRTPSFSWSPVQSAVKYRWELYEGSVLRAKMDVMMPYYTPTDCLKDGTYTWKVWAIDARGRLSQEAAQASFSKVSPAVGNLTLDYSGSRLQLGWQPVLNAAYYKVLIASDDQFSRNLQSYTTHNSLFTPEEQPRAVKQGAFYVRVISCDNNGQEGPYVEVFFKTPKVMLPAVFSVR